MPTIEENRQAWNAEYGWPADGDEWSAAWGGARMQWYGMLMPRLQAFLPVKTILEIAPGRGRMTRFLKDQCEQLVIVDMSSACIERCRERFAGFPHVTCHVNDGVSLAMVADGSIDFVFTFDSLVHADAPTLASYIAQLQHKLTADGAVFLHHSNLGEHPWQVKLHAVPVLRRALRRLRLIDESLHWRSPDMTAARLATLASQAGLKCVAQELLACGAGRALIDCFSLLVREGSKWSRENRILRNHRLRYEASRLACLSRLYASDGDQSGRFSAPSC